MASAFGWCNSEEDEMVDSERASAEVAQRFKVQFDEHYLTVANSQPQIECFTQSFTLLCTESRRRKKPLLVLVKKDTSV